MLFIKVSKQSKVCSKQWYSAIINVLFIYNLHNAQPQTLISFYDDELAEIFAS